MGPEGSFFFLPEDGASGEVTFSYRASDGVLTSPVTTVTIYLDSAPQGVVDTYTVREDTPKAVPASQGVLDNDRDRENDPLTAVLVSSPVRGLLEMSPDGSFHYTPGQDFAGMDSFVYLAMSGIRASSPVTVHLEILGSNDPPVATGDSYLAIRDQDLDISMDIGVLANDTDVDSAALTAVLVTPPVPVSYTHLPLPTIYSV